MQSHSKHSSNSSTSLNRPASPATSNSTNDDIAPPPAPSAGNQGTGLLKRTLRIRRQAAKPADGSPSCATKVASPGQDLDVPIRELVALGSGQGGLPANNDADDSMREGRSNKIKLHLKRKPAEASTVPRIPICLFCFRHFSTRTDLLDHLHVEHCSAEEQVHDQTLDHEQGEDNGGGNGGVEKKSEEEDAAADQGNDGLDLNRPMEEVQVSVVKNEEKGTCGGDDTTDGPRRKKILFDLNELPQEDEHENL